VEEYWLNLVRGRESVTVRGDEQPDAGCFDAEFFDAEFFGMTPRQAQACDPRLRLFLEVAHSAIENAGYDPAALRDRVGVFGAAVILDATVLAGLRPEDISYVEAHGTGTALGDPVEVAALTEAYPGCRIGSVQGNVGHLGAVAGMAGLVKVVLSLEREQLPPSIN